MTTITYDKLIRDKIPDIIESKGKRAEIEVLDDLKYINKLNEKLQEELDEYKKDLSIEELADLVEVVYSILKFKNVSIKEFEQIRKSKVHERGTFDKRILLKSVVE